MYKNTMLKRQLLSVLVTAYTHAIEVKENKVTNRFDVEVNISATKSNKNPWDVSGGAPDVLLKIDGGMLTFQKRCRDAYRCNLTFMSTNQNFYIEVYDKDIVSHDLIGKGMCSVGKTCHLGKAKIRIKRRVK